MYCDRFNSTQPNDDLLLHVSVYNNRRHEYYQTVTGNEPTMSPKFMMITIWRSKSSSMAFLW